MHCNCLIPLTGILCKINVIGEIGCMFCQVLLVWGGNRLPARTASVEGSHPPRVTTNDQAINYPSHYPSLPPYMCHFVRVDLFVRVDFFVVFLLLLLLILLLHVFGDVRPPRNHHFVFRVLGFFPVAVV